ncbi:MAG TPA: hypothetical protein VF855_13490 [Acidimicrobiales bacterium]
MKTRALTPLVALALALAACGGDDGGSSATTTAAPAATTTAAPAATTAVPTSSAAPTTTVKQATQREKDAVQLLVLTSADIPADLAMKVSTDSSNDEKSAADVCLTGDAGDVEPLVEASSSFENESSESISSDASVYDDASTVQRQLAIITDDKTVSCLEEALKKDFSDSLGGAGGSLTSLTLRKIDYPAVRNIGFAFDVVLTAEVAGQQIDLNVVMVGQSKGRLTQFLTVVGQGEVRAELVDELTATLKTKLDASPLS